MPFGNWKQGFRKLTMKSDRAENFVLALDRGEQPKPNKYDDANYMVNWLVSRQSQADFQFLAPNIQSLYDQYISHYESEAARQQQEIMEAEKGFIPSGGPRVKADIYVPSATQKGRTERATFPTEALVWLSEMLAKQGSSQEILQQMNQGAVAEIAGKLDVEQNAQIPQEMPQGMPPGMDPSQTIGGLPYPQGEMQ